MAAEQPTTQMNYVKAKEQILRDHICFINSEDSENPTPAGHAHRVDAYKCNCHYSWLRELHGLSALMMSNSFREKAFWVTVILVCMVFSIYNTQLILTEYQLHRTSTLITFRPVDKLLFPSLIFCPKNPDFLNYTGILTDMADHIGYLENSTFFSLIQYMIAGSGFDNVNVDSFTQEQLIQLDELYQIWKDNRTALELFDFVFSENGFTCEEFFYECSSGSETVDCCKLFKPTYVMTRGRCFRLINDYYQTDTDESDKLSVYFNKPLSPFLSEGLNPQVVVYIGDQYEEVAVYPKIYINVNDWNRIRLIQKRITMLPGNAKCSLNPMNQGKSTCFVYYWSKKLVSLLNCTLPYFYEMLPYMADTPVCEPAPVVANYDLLTSTQMDSHQYEEYEEIKSSTLAGIISELGGQSGLFLGISIVSFLQLATWIIVSAAERCQYIYDRYISVTISMG